MVRLCRNTRYRGATVGNDRSGWGLTARAFDMVSINEREEARLRVDTLTSVPGARLAVMMPPAARSISPCSCSAPRSCSADPPAVPLPMATRYASQPRTQIRPFISFISAHALKPNGTPLYRCATPTTPTVEDTSSTHPDMPRGQSQRRARERESMQKLLRVKSPRDQLTTQSLCPQKKPMPNHSPRSDVDVNISS